MTARTTPDTPGHDVGSSAVDGARYISLEEAAVLAGRHPESIRRWIRDGVIVGRRSTGRGRPYEVQENSLRSKLAEVELAPEGGGIFDPRWGPFTRDPFHRD